MDDELETERSQVLVCEECGCDSDDEARGWEGHLACEDDGSTTVVVFCPSAPSRSESGRKLEGQERQFGLFSAYPAVGMTAEEDIERVAEHLADLTRTVEAMTTQLQTLSDRTNSQQERVDSQQQRTEVQQERIDLAARELADVSERLQAAANALRESI